jgi:predicted HTH transcriptional regulator
MAIANKPLSSITESDLLDLIANQVAEGKMIDYKLTLPGNSDDEKREFLADVSSFANTVGGHLILGVDENQGIASNLAGINELDSDKENCD